MLKIQKQANFVNMICNILLTKHLLGSLNFICLLCKIFSEHFKQNFHKT